MPAPIHGTAPAATHRRLPMRVAGEHRNRRRVASLCAALLGLAVFAGACDSSTGAGNVTQGISQANGATGSTTTPPTSPGGGATGGSSSASSHVRITIKDFAFSPANFTVAPGATVSVTNNDGVAHTLTSTKQVFDSGNIAPGQTVSFTAPMTPGRYPYLCTIHPFMTGNLTVAG
jgi:plastocyanin